MDINRNELNARIEASEAKVTSAGDSLRSSYAELRAELKAGIASITADIANSKADLHATLATHTKWIAAMFFAASAAIASLISIFKPGAPSPSAPVPYVIYAQPLPATQALPFQTTRPDTPQQGP